MCMFVLGVCVCVCKISKVSQMVVVYTFNISTCVGKVEG
jgi:hypothetical protein